MPKGLPLTCWISLVHKLRYSLWSLYIYTSEADQMLFGVDII